MSHTQTQQRCCMDPEPHVRAWPVSRKYTHKILHYNQGSIAWEEGGLRRVKHVDLKYHHSQDLISTGQIKISYVPSTLKTDDCMTKALTGTFFQKSMKFLNIIELKGSVEYGYVTRHSLLSSIRAMCRDLQNLLHDIYPSVLTEWNYESLGYKP
jgi:hypothetical protein